MGLCLIVPPVFPIKEFTWKECPSPVSTNSEKVICAAWMEEAGPSGKNHRLWKVLPSGAMTLGKFLFCFEINFSLPVTNTVQRVLYTLHPASTHRTHFFHNKKLTLA